MRSGARLRLAAAAAVATVAGTATVVAAGGAGDGARPGVPLDWSGTPRVSTVPELPRDRILTGRLKNTSTRDLRLEADAVRLVDADGRPLRSTARFAAAFGHGLYSPRDAPDEVAAAEQARLGTAVVVRRGQSVPVTLSWRLGRQGRPPTEARFGERALKLPGQP